MQFACTKADQELEFSGFLKTFRAMRFTFPALPLPSPVSILPTYPEQLWVLQQEGPELGCLWPLAPAAVERLCDGWAGAFSVSQLQSCRRPCAPGGGTSQQTSTRWSDG